MLDQDLVTKVALPLSSRVKLLTPLGPEYQPFILKMNVNTGVNIQGS